MIISHYCGSPRPAQSMQIMHIDLPGAITATLQCHLSPFVHPTHLCVDELPNRTLRCQLLKIQLCHITPLTWHPTLERKLALRKHTDADNKIMAVPENLWCSLHALLTTASQTIIPTPQCFQPWY